MAADQAEQSEPSGGQTARQDVGQIITVPMYHVTVVSDLQVMPELDKEQRAALRESIETNGMLTPLTAMRSGGSYVILEGHTRHAIAAELGWTEIPVRVVELPEGMSARLYALTAELARRHLTREQRGTLIQQVTRLNWTRSDNYIASLCGCSDKTVAKWRAEIDSEDEPSTSETPKLNDGSKRTGKDGKKRPATKPPKPPAPPKPQAEPDCALIRAMLADGIEHKGIAKAAHATVALVREVALGIEQEQRAGLGPPPPVPPEHVRAALTGQEAPRAEVIEPQAVPGPWARVHAGLSDPELRDLLKAMQQSVNAKVATLTARVAELEAELARRLDRRAAEPDPAGVSESPD